MNLRASLATLIAAAVVSGTAGAEQAWLEDRRYAEGIGIRAGNLELHPGIAAELGYDSNYFQRAPSEEPIDVLRLRPVAHLSLSTLSPQRRQAGPGGASPSMNFRANAQLSYSALFALDDRYSEAVSEHDSLEGSIGFRLQALPQRPFGFDANGDYVRTAEPSSVISVRNAFNRGSLRLGAGLNYRPGGGLFEWRLVGYELRYNYFERANFQYLDNTEHAIGTRGRWRFLPRSALLYDANYGIVRYLNNTNQSDGETLTARLGLTGLVTHHFGLLAMAGWAQSYYDPRPGLSVRNYDDFVAHGEAKWFIAPQPTLEAASAVVGLSSIALGYVRDFRTSYFGDYYRRDRGYLDFEYLLAGAALLSLEAGVSRITYPIAFFYGRPPEPSFSEFRADAVFLAEYRMSDTFAVNTTLRYDGNLSEKVIQIDGESFDDLRFDRYQAWIGLRWFM